MQQRQQVVACAVERGAADIEHLAIDGNGAQAQYVVHGQTVFQAMHATGIFRHIAADGAGNLRRRIGRVIQAMWCSCFGNRQIAHAGLHARGTCQRVYGEDAVEFRQPEQYRIRAGQRAARQAGARAARNHRHARGMAQLEDGDDFRLGLRQHDHAGRTPVRRQAVGFVRGHVFMRVQHGVRADDLLQGRNQLCDGFSHSQFKKRGARVSGMVPDFYLSGLADSS